MTRDSSKSSIALGNQAGESGKHVDFVWPDIDEDMEEAFRNPPVTA